MHLRDGHYEGSKKLGHVGYIYPHVDPIGTFGGWVDQEYFPEKLKGTQYYHPTEAGEEKKLGAIYDRLKGFKKNK